MSNRFSAAVVMLAIALVIGGCQPNSRDINEARQKTRPLEDAIRELRKTNHQSKLDITDITSQYVRPGSNATETILTLELSGFIVLPDFSEPQTSVGQHYYASKRLCRGSARITGFCDEARILFSIHNKNIADLKAFLFFQSL